jgi:excinuclease UvrABC ATPase subunit
MYQRMRRIEKPPLWEFVLLSMLVHAMAITLFGAPSGGSSEGRAMWGALQVVLQDVTFEVQERSIHAVMGENGAGKSTLMQIIAGVHQPDAQADKNESDNWQDCLRFRERTPKAECIQAGEVDNQARNHPQNHAGKQENCSKMVPGFRENRGRGCLA